MLKEVYFLFYYLDKFSILNVIVLKLRRKYIILVIGVLIIGFFIYMDFIMFY